MDINIETTEITKMAEMQMARDTAFTRFAQRDQIVRIEFEIGMEMEWAHMMHLELVHASAHFTYRMQFQVLSANSRPMLRTGVRDRMLALGSIDEMANDGHKKARSWRASKENFRRASLALRR